MTDFSSAPMSPKVMRPLAATIFQVQVVDDDGCTTYNHVMTRKEADAIENGFVKEIKFTLTAADVCKMMNIYGPVDG